MEQLGTGTLLRLAAQIPAERAMVRLFDGLGDLVMRLEQPRWQLDPYPLYERIRARGPLYRGPSGMWAATSFDLCDQVLRDRRFGMRSADGHSTLRGAQRLVSGDFAWSFVGMDPPDHTRLRRLAAPAFTPRRVRGYTGRIERVVGELLDRMAGRERFDLVNEVAQPLSIAVISDLMGVPESERADFAAYSDMINQGVTGAPSIRQAKDLRVATNHLLDLFDRLLRERGREPQDDILSAMAAAAEDSELTARDLHEVAVLLLAAGFDTTANLVGNGVHAMLANPGQWTQLRERPELARAAVEETLRFEPSVQFTVRVAHTGVELGGQRIQAGQGVMLLLAAGNRDPAVFAEPGRFDLTRTGGPEHLAFGSGIHYCIGAGLARLEGEILFRELARRMPLLRPSGQARWRPIRELRGLTAFPVTATVPGQRGGSPW
ncbi:cytochrome P450 [Crossiella sp. NPDC003009]